MAKLSSLFKFEGTVGDINRKSDFIYYQSKFKKQLTNKLPQRHDLPHMQGFVKEIEGQGCFKIIYLKI